MKYIKGNMWSEFDKYDVVCITTNGVVRGDGTNVMGVGTAKECADKFPQVPGILGNKIKANGNITQMIGEKLCAFPTKGRDWSKPAELGLIKESMQQLINILNKHNKKSALVPFPGIGAGGLDKDQVMNVLNQFHDDRITIIELDDSLPKMLYTTSLKGMSKLKRKGMKIFFVARYKPQFVEDTDHYVDLAPSVSLTMDVRNNKIDENTFCDRYMSEIRSQESGVKLRAMYEEAMADINCKGVVLVSFENDEEVTRLNSPRRVLSQYLKSVFGIESKELKVTDIPKPPRAVTNQIHISSVNGYSVIKNVFKGKVICVEYNKPQFLSDEEHFSKFSVNYNLLKDYQEGIIGYDDFKKHYTTDLENKGLLVELKKIVDDTRNSNGGKTPVYIVAWNKQGLEKDQCDVLMEILNEKFNMRITKVQTHKNKDKPVDTSGASKPDTNDEFPF